MLARNCAWKGGVLETVTTIFRSQSQSRKKLHECSLARARKIFTSARMLGFSLKFPSVKRQHKFHLENKSADNGNNISHIGNWETLGKHMRAMNISGKMLPLFLDVY